MKLNILLGLSLTFCEIYARPLHYRRQPGEQAWNVGQAVLTTSGLVHGHPALNADEVSEYLGIPYAAPPIGNFRFAPPQNYTGNSTINGTSFGYSCAGPTRTTTSQYTTSLTTDTQLTDNGRTILSRLGEVEQSFSEDCLTLNIWTKPQVGEKRKAVLLWIYGGGFSIGNSDNPFYNGQYIADQEDVVIVSLNYRLNIFGFPGNPVGQNNLAFLDQRFAILWVRDNIAAFGGDPNRITLFGQSSGAESVDYYSFAWNEDPIVAGLISESGTVYSGGQATQDEAANYWYTVTFSLGCGDLLDDPNAVLACMRTKDTASILTAVSNARPPGSILGLFGPTEDNIIVFSDYPSRAKAGQIAKIPYLMGNNDYEAGFFKAYESTSGTYFPDVFWDFFDLLVFTCPCSSRAKANLDNNIPTWRYRWFGDFPNTMLLTTSDSGAWHASEIQVIFGTELPTPANTPQEDAIGAYIRGAWATFAKDPVNGLMNYGGNWPPYQLNSPTLIRLGYQNLTGTNLETPETYDNACTEIPILGPVLQPIVQALLGDLGIKVSPLLDTLGL